MMKRDFHFWVYVMASKSRRIYVGMTNNIDRRVREHKSGAIEGFTSKYNINRLVYREAFHYVASAIRREKEMKGWDRAKRVALTESQNPTSEDLSLEWGKPITLTQRFSADGKQIPRGLKPARDDNSRKSIETEMVLNN